jgi:hypothetical protein
MTANERDLAIVKQHASDGDNSALLNQFQIKYGNVEHWMCLVEPCLRAKETDPWENAQPNRKDFLRYGPFTETKADGLQEGGVIQANFLKAVLQSFGNKFVELNTTNIVEHWFKDTKRRFSKNEDGTSSAAGFRRALPVRVSFS